MRQMRKMGPLSSIVGMLPGVPKEMRNAEIDDGELSRVEAIICSMTPAERRDPAVINGSRRSRIAAGSGTTTAQVNALLKQFKMVQQMMRSLTKPGKKGKRGRRMQLPPGMTPDQLGAMPGMPGLPPVR
jgi:signal recognition particle subunit SRP54